MMTIEELERYLDARDKAKAEAALASFDAQIKMQTDQMVAEISARQAVPVSVPAPTLFRKLRLGVEAALSRIRAAGGSLWCCLSR